MLSAQSEGPFPPPVDDPLFGTYANTVYALDSRRELAEWCEWLVEQLDSAAGAKRIRA